MSGRGQVCNVRKVKWSWAGRINRLKDNRWTSRVTTSSGDTRVTTSNDDGEKEEYDDEEEEEEEEEIGYACASSPSASYVSCLYGVLFFTKTV